jgi:methionine aminopeptidase
MITLKSPSELARMRRAGRIVAEVLATLQQSIRPGVNTAELDELAYQIITKHKAIPSFKGYRGFPASLCVSINEEVVHGIPNKKRYLKFEAGHDFRAGAHGQRRGLAHTSLGRQLDGSHQRWEAFGSP